MAPRPSAPPPTPALPLTDGLPAVVLVEVPVKPVPPPLPEANAPPAPAAPEPPRRPGPTMTLGRGDRGRRTINRPRRPTSVMAGLSLGGMLLLFVLLIGASLVMWVATEIKADHGQHNGFVQVQPMPAPGQVFPPPPFQPQPFQPPMGKPSRTRPQFLEPVPPAMRQQAPGFGPPPLNGTQGALQVFNPRPPARPRFDDRLAQPRIKLQNGKIVVEQSLGNNDVRDPVRRWPAGEASLPCKAFLVELRNDKRYVIEYRGLGGFNPADQFAFDPYLRIENLDGTRLVEGDDLEQGRNLNTRIEFHPLKTATYRIICTTFHYGPRRPERFRLMISERPVWMPPPQARDPLPRPQAPVGRLAITPITEKGVQASMLWRTPMHVVGDVCWSADGQFFYVLYSNGPGGLLVKCSVNGLAERTSLNFTAMPGKLAMSAQGLVVTLLARNQLWLIDPEDLHVKRVYDVPLRRSTDAMAASPELDFVFVGAKTEFDANYPVNYGVAAVNLKQQGRDAVRFYDLPNTTLAASPKGDYLFTLDKDVLVGYKIDPATGDLEHAQTSHPFRRTVDQYRRIEFSPDNKYVCVVGVGVPLAVRRANPLLRDTAVLVFPLDDLRRPALTLDTDMLVYAVGFDPAHADNIFTESDGNRLAIFDRNGKRRSAFQLRAIGNNQRGEPQSPLQLLAHPDGDRVLMRFSDRLCMAALANAKAPPVVQRPDWPVPLPVNDGDSLAAAPFKRGDVTYRELQLPNLGDIDPCWDADGRSLFHLESDGTLTRLNAADFMPQDRLVLGQPAAAMALSAQGLLVALRDQPEVWIINPRSLRVERAIACPAGPAKFLAANPKLSIAAAVGSEVMLLDLKGGRVTVRGLQPHPDAKLAFHSPALSPDGRYLFLAHAGGGDSKVLRVRVGPRLAIEESRSTAVKGLHAFGVTADGKVAWYTPNVAGKEPTAFYPVNDWQAPAFVLADRARMIAPAGATGMYVQTTGFELQYLRDKDAKPALVSWMAGRLRIRTLAARPNQPSSFIASTGTNVYVGQRAVK